jgi:hypothetical protein
VIEVCYAKRNRCNHLVVHERASFPNATIIASSHYLFIRPSTLVVPEYQESITPPPSVLASSAGDMNTVRPVDEMNAVEFSKPLEKRKEKFPHSAAAAKRPAKKKPKDKPKRYDHRGGTFRLHPDVISCQLN